MFKWKDYTFQEVVDAVSVKAIASAVDAQYVEDLEEDYVGYKNQTIKTIINHLYTCYVITTKEMIVIKEHFLDPWRDTPNAYVTTFACKLDRRQVECEDHGVTVTKADKTDHFVSQMYACELFEANVLDDWKESNDKSWGATQPHLAK